MAKSVAQKLATSMSTLAILFRKWHITHTETGNFKVLTGNPQQEMDMSAAQKLATSKS